MKFPADVQYTSHDEWARLDGDVLTLGISDFAQDALGELVHVELPAVGRIVRAGDEVCEVESVKAVAPVYIPVAGEIIEVNSGLDGNEGIINRDPYGSGWLLRLRVTDRAGLSALIDADTYRSQKS